MEESKSSKWQRLFSEYESSGVSQRSFCEQRGLKLSTFSYWRSALNRQAPEAGEFVELASIRVSEPLEVKLLSGAVIRVPKAFDPASLKSLLEVLNA